MTDCVSCLKMEDPVHPHLSQQCLPHPPNPSSPVLLCTFVPPGHVICSQCHTLSHPLFLKSRNSKTLDFKINFKPGMVLWNGISALEALSPIPPTFSANQAPGQRARGRGRGGKRGREGGRRETQKNQ